MAIWTLSGVNQSPAAYAPIPFNMRDSITPVYHDAIAECDARTINFLIGNNSNYADYANGYYGNPPGLWKVMVPAGTLRFGINIFSAQGQSSQSGVVLRINAPPIDGSYVTITSMGYGLANLTTTKAFDCVGGGAQPIWEYFNGGDPPGKSDMTVLYGISYGYLYALTVGLTITAEGWDALSFDAAGNIIVSSTPTGPSGTPGVLPPSLVFTTSPPPEPTEAPTTGAPPPLGNWRADRNLGPWAFTEQPNKWGYLNNPRWTAQPVDPVNYDGNESNEPQIWTPPGTGFSSGDKRIHLPCGHWHKRVEITGVSGVNLYRVTDPWLQFGSIQSIYFDIATRKLKLVDYYVSNPGVCGLDTIDNKYLATMKGYQANSSLVILDKDLNVVSDTPLFHYYDVLGARDNMVAYYNGNLYLHSGNANITVVTKVSYPDLVRICRFSPGTVITGTDGHTYQFTGLWENWGNPVDYMPITGGFWNAKWDLIPDDEHAGHYSSYSDPYPDVCVGAGTCAAMVILNNRLYYSIFKSVSERILSVDLGNFHLQDRAVPSYYGAGALCKTVNNTLWTTGGVWDSYTVTKYDTSLNQLATRTISGFGRQVCSPDSIADAGDYIAVGSTRYVTGDCGIILLDKQTLATVAQFDADDMPDSDNGIQSLLAYENFLFVGTNEHVAVFDISNGSLVFLDQIFINFVPYVDVGFVSKTLRFLTI